MKYRGIQRKGKYRSTLEFKVAEHLKLLKINFQYESKKSKIKYMKPITYHTYLPDFILPNGIIVEVKGLFESKDRKKHLLIKEQFPKYDIRFVFSNSNSKLYKGAKGTYGDWCKKYGYTYADKLVPKEWLNENTSDNTRSTCPS